MQPVILAVIVHIVTFGMSVALPKILDRKPILDEVVTVNLVSLPEIAGPPQQNSAPSAKVKPVKVPEAAVKIPVEPKAAPPPAKKIKPVSLKPIKRKVRKTDPKKLAQEQARKKREQERLKALAQAREEEKRAKRAAEEARSALAEMLRTQGMQKPASQSSRRSSGGRQVSNVAEKIYYASIYDRVKQFWVLPEMRQWSPGLETRVVATIRKDGSITRTIVEKKSGNPYFDQYAMKALRKADPLPPIPKLLNRDKMEIGIVFKPGELSF